MRDLAALIGADVRAVNFYRPTKRARMPTARPPAMSSRLVDELDTTAGKDDAKDDHAEGRLRLGSERPHVCRPRWPS
jgi:hypothetical protein